MSKKSHRQILSAASVFAAAVTFNLIGASAATAQTVGTPRPHLVGGDLVPQVTQEQFGLLTLTTTIGGQCSASMLNAYWAITAAHCVYSETTPRVQLTPDQIYLQANWPNNQKSVPAVNVVSFSDGTSPSNDIALVQTGLFDFLRPDLSGSAPTLLGTTLETAAPIVPTTVTVYGAGAKAFASGSGATTVPTQYDNQFRVAQFTISGIPADGSYYTLVSQTNLPAIAGGDSGGPSLVTDWDDTSHQWVQRLLGVHSKCPTYTCLPGQVCGGTDPWRWISGTTNCQDSAVYPLQNLINQTIQQVPLPQPRDFSGTFATTPPNSDPIYLYAVDEAGTVVWSHYDAATGVWAGPTPTHHGWPNYSKVISVGANNFFALNSSDGSLWWYQDDSSYSWQGSSDNWQGPLQVGVGWDVYNTIFSGSDGIVYAIDPNGVLIWWRNPYGYANGTWGWLQNKTVGWGWDQFKTVFSMGQGIIYAVQWDGTLLWYQHNGYQDGSFNWTGPYTVGSNWQQFSSIVPAGNGVILATLPDGTLYWYKHDNYQQGISSAPGGIYDATPRAVWEGPVPIGSGWSFPNIFAELPTSVQIN